jgi:protocatechuate 3,4-dioxygenase beta subunit
MLLKFMKKNSTITGATFKKYLVLLLTILSFSFSQSVWAHTVNGYTASCNAGPTFSLDANVSNVNSSSNYAWQYKNASNVWVCIVNGNNTINGNVYAVSGATSTATTNPAPIVFNNPNSSLQGLIIRCVISDGTGVNPCNMPSGNTWNSDAASVNHTINISGTACAGCSGRVTGLYFNELNGGADLPITNGSTFTVTQLASLYNLEAGTSGTVGSVKFTITGPTSTSNIENTIPYNSPTTGGGAWTGAVGTYAVNMKTFSGSGATSTQCHDTTITFNLTNTNCNCSGTNVVLNPGFESGTTNWSWSGGTLAQGTGAVACGSFSGDLNNTSASSKAWQTIGTDLTIGTAVSVSVYAGTHDNTFNNWVAVEFLNSSNVVLSTSVYVQVDKILANAPAGPQLYNFSATVPTGTKYTRVAFGGTGSYTKTDRWCVTLTPPSGTGSIGDRVWYDANGNGIQDATETTGITGVVVQLRNSANTVIATQNTNASGNYLFTGLAAGTYTVAFPISISGAVVTTANVGADDNIDSDPSQTTGITANIVLASGQNIVNVDAGYCPVNLQLGNRVWYDTNNNGINESSENGIRNVTVNLYKDDNNDNVADGASLATVVTDVNGNYIFSNLAPGNYILGAVVPNGYMSSAVNGGDPDNNIDLDDNGQVVAGNEIRGLAISLTGGAEPTSGNTNNTYDFGMLPDCNCTTSATNLLVNGNFENGTTGWSWSGGTLTTGTGYIACGAANGFNNWSSGTSKVWQDVNMAPGVTVKFSGFAGTHTPGITCSPTLSLIFLNAANTILSQSNITVTRDVDINNSQLEQYSITAVAPAGTTKVRVQSSITCNTMKIDAFCLTSDNVGCTTCALGYPDNSNLPKSAVVFNENEVLRAMEPSSTTCGILNSGFIKLWYSDEHALLLGIDSVVVKRPNGSFYSTKYPITIYGGTPTCASNLLFGTTINTGAQSGNDVAAGDGRPIRPVLFLTDLTVNGNASRIGDWQQGGAPYNPTTVCGNWKSGYKFVDSSRNPVIVQVNPYGDPAPNISGTTWNLGGGEQPPAGTTSQSYGALVKWDINSLGLIPGHSYRIQVMVHDGDQNKEGGDAGSMCTTIYVPIVLNSSIGDRVWKDDNGNGIQDAGEVGIAGVTIVLLNATNQIIATTTTDAFGNYKFSNLAAGNYTVRITPPSNYSLSAKTQGADTNLDSDFDPTTYTTGTVILAAGQNRTDIDAGLKFTQPQPASVGDRVWLDTNGDGVQDAGEPGVSNVLVTLYNSSNVAVRSTYTDVNGNYLFTDVTPGTYTVGVSLPPAFVFSPNTGAVSGATNSDIIPATGKTASFTVNAGDQITYVDAGIKKQTAANGSIGDFVWNDINKNGIQEAGEPGIAGVTVRLLNATTSAVIATATTDLTGKYIFNDVPAGNYQVEFVTPATYTTTTKLNSNVAVSETDSDVDPATSKTAAFALAAGQRITTVDAGYWLTTGPGTGKIGDRVWLDANQNGVQDATETSVQGITVTLYDATNTAIKMAVTDANGNYLFTDLAAGNYTVGFSNVPLGYSFTTQGLGTAATGSDANPATGRTGTITLAAAQINLDVDAGIRSSMSGTASIGNRVWNDLNNNGLQDAGEPGIQGVTVELLDAAGNPIDSDPATAGVQPTTRVTNALGEYLFTGLPAGDYKVRISNLPAGFNASPKAAGTNRDIDSDGNPVAGGTSTTDVISVAAGEERLDIDFGLNNPTAPSGQIGDFVWFDSNNNGIQDAAEQGVPGVTVSLLNASSTVIATTVTDANGNYRFVNLADGSYLVKFSNLPAGFTFSPKDLGGNDNTDSDADPTTGTTGVYTIAAGNTNLTVDAGIYSTRAALGDYVWFDANSNGTQDATEKGIAGVTVTIYDAANVAVTSAITDQNGHYFFSNLNPGTYTVGFSTIPSKLVFTTKDVVSAGDAADSDVDPATGKTGSYTLVAGQVNLTVDAGLKPLVPSTVGDFVWFDLDRNGIQDPGEPGVPGVIVTLYNAANQVVGSAVTDGNGAYLISNVPAGNGYYAVFSNTPDPAAPFTLQNVGGAAANNNSKVDATGKTTPFNVAEGQNVSNIDAGVHRLINITGHVWNDANGLTDLQINKTGVQALPNSLNIYLVDVATGLVVQLADSIGSSNGVYNFPNVDVNHSYKIVLSSFLAFPGSPAPPPFLPAGWQRVGENLGAGPLSGNDGQPNGILFIDTETIDVFDANFGIRVSSGEVIIG